MNINIESIPIPKIKKQLQSNINKIQSPFSNKKIPKQQKLKKNNHRKRSVYEIDPKKKNLIELNRVINKEKLRMDKKRERSRELYKSYENHGKMIKFLQEEELKNLPKFTFKPKLNELPKKMKIEEPYLVRTYHWLENKKKHINDLKEKNDEELLKKESTLKLPIFEGKKKKIFAISKVKLFIDTLNDIHLRKTAHLNLSMTQSQTMELENQKNQSRSNLKLLRKVFSKSNLRKSLNNFSGLERKQRDVKKMRDLLDCGDGLNLNNFKKEVKKTIRQ